MGRVPTAPSQEDRQITRRLIGTDHVPADYAGQVALIAKVQAATLDRIPVRAPVPHFASRRLADLLQYGFGLCYDRNRAMAIMLRSLGFEVHEASLYSTAERPALAALLTPGNQSHAVLDVRTARGWMLVDNTSNWLATTQAGDPLSARQINDLAQGARLSGVRTAGMNAFFKKGYVTVYGLYSRHGEFYPPYSAVPDMNLHDLIAGLTSDNETPA